MATFASLCPLFVLDVAAFYAAVKSVFPQAREYGAPVNPGSSAVAAMRANVGGGRNVTIIMYEGKKGQSVVPQCLLPEEYEKLAKAFGL